tara:strand:- start:55 stop:558 length:504 start_codon:yes stop_codon:yes gene_type:complete
MGASAAASAAFSGGGNNNPNMGIAGGFGGILGMTRAGRLAQQHIARMNALRRRGGLLGGIGSIVSQGPQIGTAEQIAASGINDQDPNNLSFGSSYAGPVTQANSMMNPDIIEEATGNAPNNNITAGMAVGDAPIATAGNFNPQTEFAAARMFGNGTQFTKPKKLINL